MAAVFKRMQVSADTLRQLLDTLTSKTYGCGGLQGRYDPRNVMRLNFFKNRLDYEIDENESEGGKNSCQNPKIS